MMAIDTKSEEKHRYQDCLDRAYVALELAIAHRHGLYSVPPAIDEDQAELTVLRGLAAGVTPSAEAVGRLRRELDADRRNRARKEVR